MNSISSLLSSLINLFSSPITIEEFTNYRRQITTIIHKNDVAMYSASDTEKEAITNINGYLLNARGYFDAYNLPKSTPEGLRFYDGGIFRSRSYFKGLPVKELLIRKRVRERLRQALKLANTYNF